MSESYKDRNIRHAEFDAIESALGIASKAMAEVCVLSDKVKELEEDLAWAFHEYPELAQNPHFKSRYSYLGALDARSAARYVPSRSPDDPPTTTRTKTGE